MKITGEEYAKRDDQNDFEAFTLHLGSEHPVYDVVRERLPYVRRPYAWYVRVPNVPAFLGRISPALEQRLAQSPVVGVTPES